MYTVYINQWAQGRYKAGAAAEARILLPTDTDTRVTGADIYLGQPEYEHYEMVYRFVMPEHDVHIQTESRNTMVYRGAVPLSASGMGMMNAQAGGMSLSSAGTAAPEESGAKELCPECGTPLPAEAKFCPECGTRTARREEP